MLIEKTIPLSDFERKQLEKSQSGGWIMKMPLFLMRWFVLRNLDSFRYPKDLILPLMPECAHEIETSLLELEGAPNPVQVSVYQRKMDVGTRRPLLYFIHGGGFMGGHSLMSEGLMRYLTDRTGIITASVNYNVSPEVRHPVPLTDCHRGLGGVLERYPVDETKVFLAGDSAGGHLTAVLTLKLMREGGPVPRGQIMLYPVTDLDRIDGESYLEKGLEYTSMRKGIKLSRSVYLPDRASRKDPYVTPLHAEMKTPQPDALLLVAQRDGLRSDALRYADKLECAGGSARCVLYMGAYHSFINDLFRSDIADDAAREILDFIGERIDGKAAIMTETGG